MKALKEKILNKSVHIAPLVVFRVLFGGVMFISIIRFILKGWVRDFYISPKYYFPFYGFEWVKPLGEVGMYCLFFILALTSLMVMLGFLYRIAITLFFFLFTYVELIDKTYYLNHYYFVSIISLLLIFVPAHKYFSFDSKIYPAITVNYVPVWTINLFKFQLCILYFFAGISKLNSDWLLNAMPLKIWLQANSHLPVIGSLLEEPWIAYAFSWFGAIYDLFIWIFLLSRKSRPVAYLFVVLFHLFTSLFFPIGMFPYIMILATLIFFSEDFHKKVINFASSILKIRLEVNDKVDTDYLPANKFKVTLLSIYFIIQLTLPFRFLFYPGNLFWTEQGFRFSWRVMLMEKKGISFFYVKDSQTGLKNEVRNSEFLTPMQEVMMSTQPDMILQYSHILRDKCIENGIKAPVITAEVYVALNGRKSRLYTDTTVNMAKESESFLPYRWVLPFEE